MSRFLADILTKQPAEAKGSPPLQTMEVHPKDAGSPQTEQTEVHRENGGSPQNSKVEVKKSTKRKTAVKKSTAPAQVDLKESTEKTSGSPPSAKTADRKADRHSKNLVRQQFRIPLQHDQLFREYRAKNRLNLTEFFELAALHFITCAGSPPNAEVDTKQSADDRRLKMLYKTKPSIINLHLRYNPNLSRWTPADDEHAQKFNDYDERIIEIGIIKTQFNAKFKPIKTFKYYSNEIESAFFDSAGIENLDKFLDYLRQSYERTKLSIDAPE